MTIQEGYSLSRTRVRGLLGLPDYSRQLQAYTDMAAHLAGEGPAGDCWRTCVAMLLEVPRDTVPHIIERETWWEDTNEWVQEQGGEQLWATVPAFPWYTEAYRPRVILTGQSPRGDWLHSVVVDARTGELYYDPHPSQLGVLSRVDVVGLVPR